VLQYGVDSGLIPRVVSGRVDDKKVHVR